jgi:diguanylate cyclase (GGDEF)-like protein/PAS domain S-box-containing protein
MSKDHREDERRFEQLIDSLATVAVQGYNRDREVIYWNDASTWLYGYSKQEALGKKLEDLIIPSEMREAVIQAHHNWLQQGVAIPADELLLQHKDGRRIPVFSSHVMLKQGTDHPEMFCVDVDLSKQHQTAQELKRQASRDALTQLPNRHFFENAVQARVSEASRFQQSFSVLFIDLDNFKQINDTMGHDAGDRLLIKVAERLSAQLREYDVLCRFGGDEFVVLLPHTHHVDDLEWVAQKLIADFEHSFRLQGQDVYLTASIGISVFPENGDSVGELLKDADIAMYQAKEAGRNRYQFFDATMNESLKRHRQVVSALHHALGHDGFHLVFQPQVDLASGEIGACEALLRCAPGKGGFAMLPGEFIPIAEHSDLIIRIGRWVLEAACWQLAAWRREGLKELRIDINISGKQLKQKEFMCHFESTLAAYGCAPSEIGLELTEHTFIAGEALVLEKLETLRKAGVSISIDDFGTGYSSLSYLKRFPVDIIKIDRDFIKEIPSCEEDIAIMEAIVQVAHKLGLVIIVEGIETAEQQAFCQSLRCDYAQGYYLHRPMSASDFFALF